MTPIATPRYDMMSCTHARRKVEEDMTRSINDHTTTGSLRSTVSYMQTRLAQDGGATTTLTFRQPTHDSRQEVSIEMLRRLTRSNVSSDGSLSIGKPTISDIAIRPRVVRMPGDGHGYTTTMRPAVYIRCDFSRCDLSGMSFDGSEFYDCEFTRNMSHEHTMSGTSLEGVLMSRCVLDSMSLMRCSLVGSSFSSCSMRGASWNFSYLTGCAFDECDMSRSSFHRCVYGDAYVSGCDMSGCIKVSTNALMHDGISGCNASMTGTVRRMLLQGGNSEPTGLMPISVTNMSFHSN